MLYTILREGQKREYGESKSLFQDSETLMLSKYKLGWDYFAEKCEEDEKPAILSCNSTDDLNCPETASAY